MLRLLRDSAAFKLLWGIMGLYLLNISVDAADPYQQQVAEDLSINDQESIIELVVEQLLGFEDAIAEYDDNDSKEHSEQSGAKVKLYAPSTGRYASSHPKLEGLNRAFGPEVGARLTRGYHQLNTPPPQS